MILFVKHKFIYYKRYQCDIWGLLKVDIRVSWKNYFRSWIICFFFKIFLMRKYRRYQKMRRYVYRIDIIEHFSKRKKIDKKICKFKNCKIIFYNFTRLSI